MTKKHKPKFDFGETLPSAKKALEFLNLPIKFSDPETAEWIHKVLAEEELRRLSMIGEAYGLNSCNLFDPQHALFIATQIAREFAPEFNIYAKKRGAPRRTLAQKKIAEEVTAVMNEDSGKHSISAACCIVAKRRAKNGHSETGDEIEQIFYRFFKARDHVRLVIKDVDEAMKFDKERWEVQRERWEDSRRSGTILQGAAGHDPRASKNSDDYS